jgi:hypothetical protein
MKRKPSKIAESIAKTLDYTSDPDQLRKAILGKTGKFKIIKPKSPLQQAQWLWTFSWPGRISSIRQELYHIYNAGLITAKQMKNALDALDSASYTCRCNWESAKQMHKNKEFWQHKN